MLWSTAVKVKPYFIACQHPKSSIAPTKEAIEKSLSLGFVGQRKIEGDRAQIHVGSDGTVAVFSRKGILHREPVPQDVQKRLRQAFQPDDGWTVLDAEWDKQGKKFYLFDLLVLGGESLRSLSYEERYERLTERFFLDPNIEFLPLLKTLSACFAVLNDGNKETEGLVFKLLKAKGWQDYAIIRCRKYGVTFDPSQTSR